MCVVDQVYVSIQFFSKKLSTYCLHPEILITASLPYETYINSIFVFENISLQLKKKMQSNRRSILSMIECMYKSWSRRNWNNAVH